MPPTHRKPLLTAFVGLAVCLFGALYFVKEDGYRVGAILLVVLGLVSWRKWQMRTVTLRILILSLIYPLYSAFAVIYYEGLGSRSNIYLSMILVVPIYFAILNHQLRSAVFIFGAGIAALIAGLSALYDVYYLYNERAQALMHPIKFGDMALLFGAFSALAAFQPDLEKKYWRRCFFMTAACAGLLGSILSESRGGWIVLPALTLLVVYWSWITIRHHYLIFFITLMFGCLIIITSSNFFGISEHLKTAWIEWRDYEPLVISSIGQRISMWQIAIQMISEAPLFGHGDKAFALRVEQMQQQGVMAFSGIFNHPHNDILNAWIKHGFPAVASLLFSWLIPLIWFWRKANLPHSYCISAKAGVFLTISFPIFGLSQVMLGSESMTATYYICLSILLALTANYPARSELTRSTRSIQKKPLVIWCLSDGKPGHESQLRGLSNAMAIRSGCKIYFIKVIQQPKFLDWFCKRFPSGQQLEDPDIIISAGHKTHFSLLTAQRARGGKTVVLMKPSIPVCLFDVAVVPAHDRLEGSQVIKTRGALNCVRPGVKMPGTILILLGGPSKHFQWQDEVVLRQLEALINTYPQATISDSRRTTDGVRKTLLQKYADAYVPWAQCNPSWLSDKLSTAEIVWVTEDSVSMIYEALSSEAQVGLMNHLPAEGKPSRLVEGIKALISSGNVVCFDDWKTKGKLPPPSKFNEADKVAEKLMRLFRRL